MLAHETIKEIRNTLQNKAVAHLSVVFMPAAFGLSSQTLQALYKTSAALQRKQRLLAGALYLSHSEYSVSAYF